MPLPPNPELEKPNEYYKTTDDGYILGTVGRVQVDERGHSIDVYGIQTWVSQEMIDQFSLEEVKSLGIIRLVEACKGKGKIIDEDTIHHVWIDPRANGPLRDPVDQGEDECSEDFDKKK